MKKAVSLLLSFLLILSFCACSEGADENNNQSETEVSEGAYEIYPGIFVMEIAPFSGNYPFEVPEGQEVSNLLTAKIYNSTDKSLQLFEFTLTAGEEVYSFSAKTLLAKNSIILFDESKGEMPAGDTYDYAVTNIAEFETEPSPESEKFELSYSDSIINIKNISSEDAENVYVYYKLLSGDSLFGGITYRVSAGKVPAGEIVQLLARWFRPGQAKVVFVTYEN